MPWDKVMAKFGSGNLNSGSKDGPPVRSRKQAVAILMAEKRKAAEGDTEYQSSNEPLAGLKKAKPKRDNDDK